MLARAPLVDGKRFQDTRQLLCKAVQGPWPVSQSHRPKLGQHFLSSSRHQQRILNALDLRPDDTVLEIGAGDGAMTTLLAERVHRVVAIEIDPLLAARLRKAASSCPRISVLHGDILSTNLEDLALPREVGQWFVFGNLPYYITSPILHHLYSFYPRIRAMGLLVQREVGLRITAEPGTRAYGYLSVLVRLHSLPRVLLKVPPGAFSPPPRVVSALVGFQMRARFPDWGSETEALFLRFAQQSFGHKRKSLLNNLAEAYGRRLVEKVLRQMSLPTAIRAEELELDQLVRLFQRIAGGL